MTEPHQIPQDDLIDITEMTQKIEDCIFVILKDADVHIAISALMSATINTLIAQCDNLSEVKFFRNLFVKALDNSIKIIQTTKPGKPPSSSSS